MQKLNEDIQFITDGGVKLYCGGATAKIEDRINHELEIIAENNMTHYFLLAAHLIRSLKMLGIKVGPGLGSISGSLVAYCLGITRVDPIKYDLLFERFLNHGNNRYISF